MIDFRNRPSFQGPQTFPWWTQALRPVSFAQRSPQPGGISPSIERDARDQRRGDEKFKPAWHLPTENAAMRASWRRTSPWRSTLCAIKHSGAVMALAMLHVLFFPDNGSATSWIAWGAGYIVVQFLIAHHLRGLEALVHEGSHYNWAGKMRKQLNDVLTNWFAAYSVFQSVEQFRPSHRTHHQHLGDPLDPCYIRYLQLWTNLNWKSVPAFLREMRRTFVVYNKTWWRLIGSDKSVMVRSLAWHLMNYVLPFYLAYVLTGKGPVLSIGLALATWVAYFAFAFVLPLPIIRFIGEAQKHDYAHGTTTLDGTFSNIGILNWLIHPTGDAYHFLHHSDPHITHWNAKRAHKWLLQHDRVYATTRMRTYFVEEPELCGAAKERHKEIRGNSTNENKDEG